MILKGLYDSVVASNCCTEYIKQRMHLVETVNKQRA